MDEGLAISRRPTSHAPSSSNVSTSLVVYTVPQCCEESDPWNCSKVESIRNDSSSQPHEIGNTRIELAWVTLPRNEIFDATVASLPRLEYAIYMEVIVVGLWHILQFLLVKLAFYMLCDQVHHSPVGT